MKSPTKHYFCTQCVRFSDTLLALALCLWVLCEEIAEQICNYVDCEDARDVHHFSYHLCTLMIFAYIAFGIASAGLVINTLSLFSKGTGLVSYILCEIGFNELILPWWVVVVGLLISPLTANVIIVSHRRLQ